MNSSMNKNGLPKEFAENVDAYTVISPRANTYTVRGSIVSVFPERPADPTSAQVFRLIEQSGTLDFWSDKAEDIYTLDDGTEI